MKTLSRREDIIYSIGGLILLALIFSGFKGMLAAAAVIGWLCLVSGAEKHMEQTDKNTLFEEEQEDVMQEEEVLEPQANVYYVSAQEWRRGRRKAS